jgi:aquaporin Z
MQLLKKGLAEALGTFVLVFFACGTAILSGGDLVATALSFGLVIVAMAYTVGNVSGCHINPAVSFGIVISQKLTKKKDFGWKDFGVYVLAQFAGAIIGAAALFGIIKGGFRDGFSDSFATNGLMNADSTAGNYAAAIFLELILTAIFVYVILTVISNRKTEKKAGLIIGLTLTLVHLIGINFTGTSVNPARSFGPALMRTAFGGGTGALEIIWVFLLAPMAGAVIAALLYKAFRAKKDAVDNPVPETIGAVGQPESAANEKEAERD